jgi:hypothetical protein
MVSRWIFLWIFYSDYRKMRVERFEDLIARQKKQLSRKAAKAQRKTYLFRHSHVLGPLPLALGPCTSAIDPFTPITDNR